MCPLYYTLFVFLVLVSSSAPNKLPPALIWSETFDELNLTRWKHIVTAWDGGNAEFQYYRNNRKNSYVRHGKLYIQPTFTAEEYGEEFLQKGTLDDPECNNQPCAQRGSSREYLQPILSAKLISKESFSFKYGRLEVRAKMPRGDWIWPAIWMMPEGDKYGGWPRSGEIDIVEIRANPNYVDQNNVTQGIQRVTSTLHFGPDPNNDRYYLLPWSKLLNKGDFSDQFHTFTFEWTSKAIAMLVDGVEYARLTPPGGGMWQYGAFDKHPGGDNIWAGRESIAPFDQKFYIILNVAVGGRFFPDSWKSNGKQRPWSWNGGPRKQFWQARDEWEPTWDRPHMIIDHILVYGWGDE